MITPIGTMKINQIVERRNDLLMSADDIEEMARNVRNKALDEFVEQIDKHIFEETTEEQYSNSVSFMREIRKIAEELKGVQE